MKINSVYIASFGGIKNKTVDFSKGFTAKTKGVNLPLWPL